ncbi:MAG: glycosyltransferase family 2 protein [Planctomycetota bacterium]|jgi:glycosyltransferase involved in cell wall biosynthesis
MPQVSVVLPVHNAAPYLEEAMASVLGQTFEGFELICADDGSTDGSGAILARFAKEDSRVRLLQPGRIGLIATANLLRAEARTPLLARFDADDRMDPSRLECQLELLAARPEIDIVGSLVRHYPDEAVGEGTRRYEGWLNRLITHEQMRRDFLVELPLPNPSAMFRVEVFDRVGGYVDDGLPEDYSFWLRALEAGFVFAKVDAVLHYWREHPARVTRTHPRYSVEAFLKAKTRFLLRGPLANDAPFVVWGAGMMGRRLTRLLVRAGRPPVAILDIDPRKAGRTRQGRPILPVDSFRPGSAMILAAVGARGARERIRARLDAWGLVETRDFWMVA